MNTIKRFHTAIAQARSRHPAFDVQGTLLLDPLAQAIDWMTGGPISKPLKEAT